MTNKKHDSSTKHQEFIQMCSRIKNVNYTDKTLFYKSNDNSLKITSSTSFFSYYKRNNTIYSTRVFNITYSDNITETFIYEADKNPEDYIIINRQLILKSEYYKQLKTMFYLNNQRAVNTEQEPNSIAMLPIDCINHIFTFLN